MFTSYDESRDAVVYPWTPPFHPQPVLAVQPESELLDTAAALHARVRAAAETCAQRAADVDCQPCLVLDELTTEMRKIDLCLQQMLLALGTVTPPTTDADFTADLEVDFVPAFSDTDFSEAA